VSQVTARERERESERAHKQPKKNQIKVEYKVFMCCLQFNKLEKYKKKNNNNKKKKI